MNKREKYNRKYECVFCSVKMSEMDNPMEPFGECWECDTEGAEKWNNGLHVFALNGDPDNTPYPIEE